MDNADQPTAGGQCSRVQERQDAPSRLHWSGLLLDDLRQGQGTHGKKQHHRHAYDRQADEVTREVRHAIKWDGGITGLHDHATGATPDGLVSRPQRHLHRPHHSLVTAGSRLRYGTCSCLDRGPLGGSHRRPELARTPLLLTLARHRGRSLLASPFDGEVARSAEGGGSSLSRRQKVGLAKGVAPTPTLPAKRGGDLNRQAVEGPVVGRGV